MLANEITVEQAFERASQPFRAFMLKNVRDKELKLFNDMAKSRRRRHPSSYRCGLRDLAGVDGVAALDILRPHDAGDDQLANPSKLTRIS